MLQFDQIFFGPDDVRFGYLESVLNEAADRQKHVVLTFSLIDAQENVLHVPQYLKGQVRTQEVFIDGVTFDCPNFNDGVLLNPILETIDALGQYDGDKRIQAIHISFVGIWYVAAMLPCAQNTHGVPRHLLTNQGGVPYVSIEYWM